MNERRTRPSAPVNDRVEEVPRAYDWVSPWSLDPDLPPPRRPRPLGLQGTAAVSLVAMPPPGLPSFGEKLAVEPVPETHLPESPQQSGTLSPKNAAPAQPPADKVIPALNEKAPFPAFPPNERVRGAEPREPLGELPPPEPDFEPDPPPPSIRPKADPPSGRPLVRQLPSFPDSRIDAKPREPLAPVPPPAANAPGLDIPLRDEPREPRAQEHANRFSRSDPQLSLTLQQPKSKPRSAPAESGISWGTLIFLSLGLLSFAFGAWIYLHDIEPEMDDDLRIDRPVDVTPVITAPDRLQMFLHSIIPLESRELALRPPSDWDTPSLSRFVQANGPALGNLKDFLEDPDWHPRHSSWHGIDLGSHRSWVQAGILKQAEAAYLSRLQKEEAAFTAAIDLAELAHRLEDMWAWPSFSRRSIEMHRRAAQTLAVLLRQTRLSASQLAQFHQQHQSCAPGTETFVRAINAFYIHEKKLLLGAGSGEPLDTMPGGVLNRRPGRLLFKVNETLSLFADCMRQLKSGIAEAPFSEMTAAEELVRRTRKEALVFYQPNAAGQAYFCERMEDYIHLPADTARARTQHGLVHTLFAIRRALAETKRIPQTLPDLVPAYLEGLPTDPYSGEPFLYNAPRGILYSVGDNFTDEDGMITEPPMNDPGEPTVQIGVAAAAAIR